MDQALDGNGRRTRHRTRAVALLVGIVTVATVVAATLGASLVADNAAATTVKAPPAPAVTTNTTAPKVKTTTTTTTTTAPKSKTPTTTTTPALKTKPTNTTTTTTTTTTLPPPVVADNCSTDVSAALTARLEALPSGAVFTAPAGACYQVDEGVVITHPLTIIGGTFRNESLLTTPRAGGHFRPIIEILETSDVTLSGITIEGANFNGAYHPLLVGEAGVKVLSSADVTLDNISVMDTFGDGLELVADLGHSVRPDSDLVVNGYSTDDTGRQGMTFAEVEGATLTNVHIVAPADAGFDFESDEPHLGSGNISISDCTYQHGLNVVERLYGPLTLTNCSGGSDFYILDGGIRQPVRVSGGSLRCEVRAPIACIHLSGGSLTLTGMAITRHRSREKMTEPAWNVVNDGTLSLVHTSVVGPLGKHDATSRVLVSP